MSAGSSMIILLSRKKPRYLTQPRVIWASRESYDQAISDFDTALRLWPVNFGILAIRGGAYADMGQHDNALADSIHSAQSFLHRGPIDSGDVLVPATQFRVTRPQTFAGAAPIYNNNPSEPLLAIDVTRSGSGAPRKRFRLRPILTNGVIMPEIFEKWAFGMAPPKVLTQRERTRAATYLLEVIEGVAANPLTSLLT